MRTTSQKVSSAAAKILKDPRASKAEKAVTASTLTQSRTGKVLHNAFTIGSAHQEFHDNLAFLHENWPWPSSKLEIVEALIREEANKLRRIHEAVASVVGKKKRKAAR